MNAQDSTASAGDFSSKIRTAVFWRSGTQIVGQLIAWASTFLVIRILQPSDYGLFAMTQVVLALVTMLNGYGLASGLIQQEEVSRDQIRQVFGMLLLLNGAIAVLQFFSAPLVAAYYRQPEVATLLRVQCLLHITTPFIVLSYALLSRTMEFPRQAKVTILAAVVGALCSLGGALGGLGVWTLVLAPLALFATRAIGMTIAAGAWIWPSFRFTGSGGIVRYGGLMAMGQIFSFLQFQTDIFIAGRHFSPHMIGIYSTSLFLTQIFVSKFVPPINEVAFSAYARLQGEPGALAYVFLQFTRLVLMAGIPFYLGMAATAEPLVLTVLGPHWAEAAPIVQLLALGMPFYTLQVMLGPATNAAGHPGISTLTAAGGAILLPCLFLIALPWGLLAFAACWLIAYPLLLTFALPRSLPVLGLSARQLGHAIAPPIIAGVAMAILVRMADGALPRIGLAMGPAPRLAILVTVGALFYGGWLLLFERDSLKEMLALLRKKGNA